MSKTVDSTPNGWAIVSGKCDAVIQRNNVAVLSLPVAEAHKLSDLLAEHFTAEPVEVSPLAAEPTFEQEESAIQLILEENCIGVVVHDGPLEPSERNTWLSRGEARRLRDLLCEQYGLPDAAAKLCSGTVDACVEARDQLAAGQADVELAYQHLLACDLDDADAYHIARAKAALTRCLGARAGELRAAPMPTREKPLPSQPTVSAHQERCRMAYSWLLRGDASQALRLLARAIGTDVAAQLRAETPPVSVSPLAMEPGAGESVQAGREDLERALAAVRDCQRTRLEPDPDDLLQATALDVARQCLARALGVQS